MARRPLWLVATLVAAGCGERAPRAEAGADAAGYRVAVPGALLGRFPIDSHDLESDTFLASAFGLAVDDSSIFVLDVMTRRVYGLDAEARLIGTAGRRGRGPGELASPMAIRVGPGGDVWVADPEGSRLSRFRRSGAHVGDVRTPYPVLNFGVSASEEAVITTMSSASLLARLDREGRATDIVVGPGDVPVRLRGLEDRLPLHAVSILPLAEDTLLLVRSRHGTDFGAWTVALAPGRDSIRRVSPLPLPEWLYTLLEREVELVRRQVPDAFETGDWLVPLKSARVVDGTLWLAPAPSARVIAVSVARTPRDSATVVVPRADEAVELLDAAVVQDRLVALYPTEVRVYRLERGDRDLFTRPN